MSTPEVRCPGCAKAWTASDADTLKAALRKHEDETGHFSEQAGPTGATIDAVIEAVSNVVRQA